MYTLSSDRKMEETEVKVGRVLLKPIKKIVQGLLRLLEGLSRWTL